MYEKEVTIQTDIKVILHEPEKTKTYFIDGDWKDYFFTYSDLDELIEDLALNARFVGVESHRGDNGVYERVIDIEGWPLFKRQGYTDSYVAENSVGSDGETGKIEIVWDEDYYVF